MKTFFRVIEIEEDGHENYTEYDQTLEEVAINHANNSWSCNQGNYQSVMVEKVTIDEEHPQNEHHEYIIIYE